MWGMRVVLCYLRHVHTASLNAQFKFIAHIPFLCLTVHIIIRFQCELLMALNWPAYAKEKQQRSHAARCHTEVNMEPLKSAFTVSFISWCAVEASKFMSRWQQARGWGESFFNYGFLWSNGCYFCREVRVDVGSSQEWWDRDVNGFTETDSIQKCDECDIKTAWILIWLFRLRSHCKKSGLYLI